MSLSVVEHKALAQNLSTVTTVTATTNTSATAATSIITTATNSSTTTGKSTLAAAGSSTTPKGQAREIFFVPFCAKREANFLKLPVGLIRRHFEFSVN
jgi:hypothetical protein